jgi:hypothetical protein
VVKQFEILRANRLIILKVIEDLTIDQLNKIPAGFKNNIAWNLTHLLVTQQLLCYRFSGVKVAIDEDMIDNYKKGTEPMGLISLTEFEAINTQFLLLVDRFIKDFDTAIFKEYQPYTTSANVTLNNIQDAIEFNNFHEGIHLGYILALKKLV